MMPELDTVIEKINELLRFEKFLDYANAIATHKYIVEHFKLGRIWSLILSGIQNRILAKNAASKKAYLLSGFYYDRAAKLFYEVTKITENHFRDKWFLASNEMAQKYKDVISTFDPNKIFDSKSDFTQIYHSFNNGISSNILNTKLKEDEKLLLITGGVHSNEISSIYAVNELCRLLESSDNSLVLWSCVDLNGFLCNKLLSNSEQIKCNLENTEFIRYDKQHKAFLLKPRNSATKDWLSEFSNFVINHRQQYNAKYAIWVSPNNYGRTFEIRKNSLVQIFSQDAKNSVSNYFNILLKQNNFLWIDLHEARGDRFHLYIDETNKYMKEIAENLVKHISDNQFSVNKEIWNRAKISDGIFSFPNNSCDWKCSNRIIVEVGEKLPLCDKVAVLYLSIKFMVKAFRNGHK